MTEITGTNLLCWFERSGTLLCAFETKKYLHTKVCMNFGVECLILR